MIAELLKELGEDQAVIDGYCPRTAGCLGFTTLRCMKDKFYSGDGTDDFDLDISTAGCPRGQQKYVLKRKPDAAGRLLSYFVICDCNDKY